MPAVIISNYKRPGIYINEYDNSVLSSNTTQGITNLVIGVSKTGPINTPVLIKTTQDLTNYFGGIDRTLERKGSFFQRTIAQMIQSSPVYALNLLETDSTLDKIEYAPLSTATNNTNDSITTGALSAFYDTTGFWKLSTDSFLSLVANNENYEKRLLNFTNVSGSYITVFVFKTTATGFDVSMTQWYGSITNVPSYVYPTDYVSDYMVDVIVVAGDWSNYQSLAVDKTFSKYFDSTGLIKSQVDNFINDRNVTLLKYYQGLSFIPYFRDQNNQNIFIETVINQDTQVTGLFCAFNADLLEQDYPTGAIDLLGNNLINSDSLLDSTATSIDFLSYQQDLISFNDYSNTYLDTVGNVYSIDPGNKFYKSYGASPRTNTFAEGKISGIWRNISTFSSTTAAVNYVVASGSNIYNSNSPYAIIGGNLVNITSGSYTFSVSATNFASASATYSYYSTIKLDSTGSITNVTSTVASTAPTVAATDMVLGYMSISVKGGNVTALNYTDVTIGTNSVSNGSFGYKELAYTTDYTISSSAVNSITITFTDTAAHPDTSNYTQYRRIKRFNAIRTILESSALGRAAIMLSTDGTTYYKYSMSNMSISSVTDTTLNKSITISNMGFSTTDFNNILTVLQSTDKCVVIYADDNELILSDNQMITTTAQATTNITGASAVGVVAKYSSLYEDYYNGVINTGDYFYANVMAYNLGGGLYGVYTASTVTFVKPTTLTGSNATYNGLNFIVIQSSINQDPFNGNFGVSFNNILIPDSTYNTGALTIGSSYNSKPIGYNFATELGYTASYSYAYYLSDAVTSETLTNITRIWNADVKYYLSMDIDSSDNLTVKITDNTLYTYKGVNTDLNVYWGANKHLYFNSFESNYQDSVEIEIPSGYTQVPNQILVDATRYSNIIVGDFLLQDNSSVELEIGQQAKNLTRILSKKVYSADTSLSLITCDAAIYKFPIGSPSSTTTYQTIRYASLDNYVTTYKAIPLKGFRIRQDSLPNGTDAKQTEILNLVEKGTPLYNALINKDAIDFRYLVDSFGLGLTEFSKQQLVDICGGRLNCLGFINMPSIKQFKNSSSPSFTDTLTNGTKVLNTAYIAQGGDLNTNPAFLYSFAEGSGTTCVGYFTPYVTVNDNGSPLSVPPAMYVASTYMRKFTTNVTSILPWTIAAGVQNGLLQGIAGVEMDFSPTDIDNLNMAQMNPIIYKKNRGWIINTENTALTLYKSALSYLHVREVLIELENALVDMLLNFQWKFNTQDTRSEIKLRADVICAGFVNKNGLYNYFNKCDAENNTTTLIDNQIGVLDTYIEPIKGLAVIVNNITVLKTGSIQAGGFQTL